MSVTLLQLVELNERKQFLTSSVMFNIRWKDEYLAWRPSLNSNITSLVIPSGKIWKPDILLYQSIKEQFDQKVNQEGFDFDNIVVDNFGNCSWMPPDKLKSSCSLDMEYFPYDTQVCELKFGSWSYRKHLLRLSMETRENKHGELMAIHIDQNQFINSTAWEILKTEGFLSDTSYDCCEGIYQDITYKIYLKRFTYFPSMTLGKKVLSKPKIHLKVLPCVLCALLILCTFFLPAQSGEKIVLSITILLAMVFFMAQLSSKTPRMPNTLPVIGQFFVTSCCLISISMAFTVISLKFYHQKGSRSMGRFLPTCYNMEPFPKAEEMVFPSVRDSDPLPVGMKNGPAGHLYREIRFIANKN
ncbi:unnamed protein product [Oikopleura dioica]|uniref:Neurotransmitter-gated ion-channel ligand-binding domain-containing protein n=1 Tax=Oikopleura dioica TaxID=34765 RepID=E4YHD8_OIKDI|nr:unnamed protein product [Oikopleura dioica]